MKHTIFSFERYCMKCEHRKSSGLDTGPIYCHKVKEYSKSHIGNYWPKTGYYVNGEFNIPEECPYTLEISVDQPWM